MGFKVRGYAAVFGNKDLAGEVVARGAFSGWMDNGAKQLDIYWNHAHRWNPLAKPIGRTTKLKQDRTGLYFEGELHETPEGQEVAEILRGGRLESSFAYFIEDREQKKGVWHLTALVPREITATSFGINQKAYMEAMPGQDEPQENDNAA